MHSENAANRSPLIREHRACTQELAIGLRLEFKDHSIARAVLLGGIQPTRIGEPDQIVQAIKTMRWVVHGMRPAQQYAAVRVHMIVASLKGREKWVIIQRLKLGVYLTTGINSSNQSIGSNVEPILPRNYFAASYACDLKTIISSTIDK